MLLLGIVASLPAHALDPSRSLSQFGHSVWRSLDGDFTGNPTSVTQTLDGYIWVGTSTGVKRFDGARFDVLAPPANEALARPMVYAVRGARDGSLWIGTSADLEQWKSGHLVHHELKARIHAIAEDAAGNVWTVRAGNDDG